VGCAQDLRPQRSIVDALATQRGDGQAGGCQHPDRHRDQSEPDVLSRRLRSNRHGDVGAEQHRSAHDPPQPAVDDGPPPPHHPTDGDGEAAEHGEVRRADLRQPRIPIAVGDRHDEQPQQHGQRQGDDAGVDGTLPTRMVAVVQVEQEQAGKREHCRTDVPRLNDEQ